MKLEHVGKRKTPHTHAAPMCWLEIPSLDYLMEIEKLCKSEICFSFGLQEPLRSLYYLWLHWGCILD